MTKSAMNERIDSRKAPEMFQQLPQEERFRVEGIIVGMTLAREQTHPEERQDSA